MIEVQLFTQSHEKTILTFENNVLEYFYGTSNGETRRYHVGQIKSIEFGCGSATRHESTPLCFRPCAMKAGKL